MIIDEIQLSRIANGWVVHFYIPQMGDSRYSSDRTHHIDDLSELPALVADREREQVKSMKIGSPPNVV